MSWIVFIRHQSKPLPWWIASFRLSVEKPSNSSSSYTLTPSSLTPWRSCRPHILIRWQWFKVHHFCACLRKDINCVIRLQKKSKELRSSKWPYLLLGLIWLRSQCNASTEYDSPGRFMRFINNYPKRSLFLCITCYLKSRRSCFLNSGLTSPKLPAWPEFVDGWPASKPFQAPLRHTETTYLQGDMYYTLALQKAVDE